MKKYFLALFAFMFVFAFGSFVLAHGDEATSTGMGMTDDKMMGMDSMMTNMMTEEKNIDCSKVDSHILTDKGEDLMEKMLNGDKERHERIEQAMEADGMAFHDDIHMMMGRMATGCLSDAEQKLVAAKMQSKNFPANMMDIDTKQQSSQSTSALVMGLIIGAMAGLIIASIFKKRT